MNIDSFLTGHRHRIHSSDYVTLAVKSLDTAVYSSFRILSTLYTVYTLKTSNMWINIAKEKS